MAEAQTSRRALIGALALATPIGALAVSQCAAQPAHAISNNPLNVAIARYAAAVATEQQFDCSIYNDAMLAFDRAEAAFNKAWPHTFHELTGLVCVASTADHALARHVRCSVNSVCYLEACGWENHRNEVAFLDAYDRREAALSALPDGAHMDAMTVRSDALLKARIAARDAVAETPVTSLPDFVAKFEFLAKVEWLDGVALDNENFRPFLRADLQRLLTGGLN